ncbi:MAG: maleylpyruvate isomerase N-terminal domain-containing protein [Ilumatobacteraceae bacterium]
MSEHIRRYVQAVYGLDAVVQRTAQDQWQNPSPCDGWVALDVIVHNALSFQMFANMARGTPAAVPAPPDGSGVPAPSDDGHVFDANVLASASRLPAEYSADPISCWNRDRDDLIAALDDPGVGELRTHSPWGETDMDTWLSFAVWDPIVHTWDLAEAVDQPTVVDSRLCELALSAARTFDAEHNLRRPGVAAAEVHASSADAVERLLRFAGRDLSWRDRRGFVPPHEDPAR